MQSRVTEQCRRAIDYARGEAGRDGAPCIEPEHLLFGVLRDEHSEACVDLRTLGYLPAAIQTDLTALLDSLRVGCTDQGVCSPNLIPLSPASCASLEKAADISARFGRHYVGPEHILMALITEPTPALAALWKRHKVKIVLSPSGQRNSRHESAPIPSESDFVVPPDSLEMPVWDRYTHQAKRAIGHAQSEATRSGCNVIPAVFLLAGVLQDGETVVTNMLSRCGVERNTLREALADRLGAGPGFDPDKDVILATDALAAVTEARAASLRLGDRHIGTEHLMLGLLADRNEAGEILRAHGLATTNFTHALRRVKRGNRVEGDKRGDPLTTMLVWLAVVAVLMGLASLQRGCH